jgi:hypothetical protein
LQWIRTADWITRDGCRDHAHVRVWQWRTASPHVGCEQFRFDLGLILSFPAKSAGIARQSIVSRSIKQDSKLARVKNRARRAGDSFE